MPRGERNDNRQRRERRNHHLNPLLPSRPKRPLTGYGQFLKDFFTQATQDNRPMDREAMRTAAQAWRDLSLDEKYTYTERVSNEREIYEKQMATWKKYRDGLKKPPTAYGHFVQVVWNQNRRSGRTVGQMGRHAAALWRALPAAEKQYYHNTREYLMTKYKEEMDRVRAGGELNLNWMTEEMERFELALIDAGGVIDENVHNIDDMNGNEHDDEEENDGEEEDDEDDD